MPAALRHQACSLSPCHVCACLLQQSCAPAPTGRDAWQWRCFALFNHKQRKKAQAFLQRSPAAELVLAVLTLEVSASTLRAVEHASSREAEVRQYAERTEPDPTPWSRLTEAAAGSLQKSAEKTIAGLAAPGPHWVALPPGAATIANANLSFCMLATSIGMLELLLFREYRRMPYQLWRLLDPGASEGMATELLATPMCMRDTFSANFLAAFPSPEALLSENCKAILLGMAAVTKLDICRIECRHAPGAPHSPLRGVQTHAASHEGASADFVCRALARANHDHLHGGPHAAQPLGPLPCPAAPISTSRSVTRRRAF